MKNNPMVRIDKETKQWLREIALEISYIEGKTVSMGEVIRRFKNGEDSRSRLIKGATERRYGLK